MKFLRKIKFFVLIINFVLIFCGFLFIGDFFKETKINGKLKKNVAQKSIADDGEKMLIDELAKCKSDLFVAKNELERLKFVPDSRLDTIKLMLLMRDIENKIGKKTDFSSDCVSFFSLALRIPVVQEFVLPYKKQMFKNNCNFANNSKIIEMIAPFQIKYLEDKRAKEHYEEKFYKRFYTNMQYQISKLFVKSKFKKSDIETAIEQFRYNDALEILLEMNFERNDEFNALYDAISSLKNFKQMIDGIYNILQSN